MACKKTVHVLAILIWALLLQPFASAAIKKSSTEAYLEQLHNQGKERVIVTFKDKINETALANFDVKLIRKLKIINAIVCEVNQTDIELLKQQENVKDVVPDMLIRIPEPLKHELPSEDIAPLAYEGPVTVRWNNLEAGLNSQAAWDNYELDGTGIKIAFLDTGVNYIMENLDDNYLGGYDYVGTPPDYFDDDNPINQDDNEVHGTKVVSLAVGEGTDKIVGVAYNASYYVVRVMEGYGPATGWIGDVISGIEWASTEPHKADIISMSLGFYEPINQTAKIYLRNACNNAYAQGIVLVAASGNDGGEDSDYPAAFANVISVGAHAEDQTLYDYEGSSTNGGVDIIAPGACVLTVKPDNSTWWVWGTSHAVPHASALIALQLQYARENNIDLNNGYNWEVMKNSAVDLGIDPVFQGEGKIYAAQTDGNDANVGSIDLIASNWPIDYEFQFSDYAFIDANIPVYQIGKDVNQTITLTNITDTIGNYPNDIENLDVNAVQVYYGVPNEPNLPGNSIEVFPTVTLLEPNDANSITLSLLYTIPPETSPGLVKTKLEFEFNFVGNDRVIKVSYNEPNSFWYAAIPGDLDLENDVDLTDYGTFAIQWRQADCNEPDFCGRADIDQSGNVDYSDLYILTENWLTGL